VSQEGKSTFWEVIVSVILNNKCMCTCVLFRTVSGIELFHCTAPKFLIRKGYCVLFLTPVFVVQLQFTWYNTFSKIPPSTSIHFQLVWGHGVLLVCTVYSTVLYSEIALYQKPFGIGHTYIYNFCLEWPILWPPRILTFPPRTLCIIWGRLKTRKCKSFADAVYGCETAGRTREQEREWEAQKLVPT
jgi:hypothetical protein